MRLLDLFCKAGGAAEGYSRAGFDSIIGVDIEHQKRRPPTPGQHTFVQMDALDYMRYFFDPDAFDLIHASPPCQRYSVATRSHNRDNHPDIIEEVRRILESSHLPYVLENVIGAPLIKEKSIMLCGTMFDLGVFRHRLFETNFQVRQLAHPRHTGRIGDGKYFSVTGGGGLCKGGGGKLVNNGTADQWRAAMGLGWMTRKELTQAVPPAYTEYIGWEFINNMN